MSSISGNSLSSYNSYSSMDTTTFSSSGITYPTSSSSGITYPTSSSSGITYPTNSTSTSSTDTTSTTSSTATTAASMNEKDAEQAAQSLAAQGNQNNEDKLLEKTNKHIATAGGVVSADQGPNGDAKVGIEKENRDIAKTAEHHHAPAAPRTNLV